MIHTREADADTLEVLDTAGAGRARGVFHCFTGDQALADAAVARGFHVSFSGIVTFPRAEALRAVAATIPPDRWLVETDSPYLSPAPQRGGRNEPARVVRVLETLASCARIVGTQRLRPRPSPMPQRCSATTAPTGRRALTASPQCVEIPEVSHVQPSSSPSDLAQLFEPVREDLERVNQAFLRHIDSRVELIPEIGKYLQNTGGKRVRPAVMLMASRLAGGQAQSDMAVLYASVIEFIHTATLVHDDIIDDSELRRGRLAVHARWGNDVTVLLGDYLYIKSLGMALEYDRIDVLRVLCDITLKMIEGELYQLTKNGDTEITEDEHFDIIRRKTAYLFAGCCRRSAAWSGTITPAQEQALWDYGFNLGVAFQLVDDLLDYTADQAALGKPIGSDLREGKLTLPIILLRDRVPDQARPIIEQVVRDADISDEAWRQLLGLLREYDIVPQVTRRAGEYVEQARRQLVSFPESRERDALLGLADYVLARDR